MGRIVWYPDAVGRIVWYLDAVDRIIWYPDDVDRIVLYPDDDSLCYICIPVPLTPASRQALYLFLSRLLFDRESLSFVLC